MADSLITGGGSISDPLPPPLDPNALTQRILNRIKTCASRWINFPYTAPGTGAAAPLMGASDLRVAVLITTTATSCILSFTVGNGGAVPCAIISASGGPLILTLDDFGPLLQGQILQNAAAGQTTYAIETRLQT